MADHSNDSSRGNVLIVDDTPANLQVLSGMLKDNGYKVRPAPSGKLALQGARGETPDLILLDITMPEMDGYEVCRHLKSDEKLNGVPVIFISALSETLDKVKAFAVGGVDYITKPFQMEEVLARVETHLKLSRLQHELEHNNLKLEEANQSLIEDKKRIDQLLLNVLPAAVIEELKTTGYVKPVSYKSVSIVFTDFVGFTSIVEKMSPERLIKELDECFSFFDMVVNKFKLEKLKTIGDSYMFTGGVPVPRATSHVDAVLAAMEILQIMRLKNENKRRNGEDVWEIRIGINTGPLMAGIIGERKFAYDVWGDSVNIASRMETHGDIGKINISAYTNEMVKDFFVTEHRGKVEAKNKGQIDMFFVKGIHKNLSKDEEGQVPNEKFHELCALLETQN